MNRYILRKKNDLPGWWVLTDTVNQVAIQFKEHHFKESQEISLLEDSPLAKDPDCVNKLAHVLSAMENHLFEHWYSLAMSVPAFEFRRDERTGRMLLIRNKYPKFAVEIQDNCDMKQLSDALKSAAEYIKKRRYGRKEGQ